jgi:hypothetical protein
MRNKSEKRFDEIVRKELLLDLSHGKVLVNYTNGFVYLDKQGKQVKIGVGKRRKNKDYSFSHPEYWRTLNWFEGFRVKTGLYKVWKVNY